MIAASNEWKNLHKQPLLPETFIEIRIDVTDLNVTDLVSTSGSNQATFSNTTAIINRENPTPDEQYALLEYNLWALDGSKNIVDATDTHHALGFVSKNDEECTLKISLSEIRSAGTPGFRILWSSEYGEYATSFTLTVKKSDTVVETISVNNNTDTITQVEVEVADYDSVTITVHDWSVPEHRSRIDGVTFGAAIVFDKSQILSYTHEQTGDPMGGEISKNSIDFSVDNTDGRWDMLNPGSLEKYLYERQPVSVRYGIQTNVGIEWIQAGKFYLTEWRAPSNGVEATFAARDAFEFMLNTPYSCGSRKGVVIEAPEDFSNQMTDVGIRVFSSIEGISKATEGIRTTLPFGTVVTIYEAATYAWGSSGHYTAYRIEQGWIASACVNLADDLTILPNVISAIESCEIPVYSAVYGDRFSDDSVPYIITDTTVAEFIQKCANKCAYSMWQNADGVMRFAAPGKTLTDYRISDDFSYSYPETELSKPLKQIDVVCYQKYDTETSVLTIGVNNTGDVVRIDNSFVWADSEFTEETAQRYLEWWKHRGWVSGEFRADPRLELFDVVSVDGKYGVISPVLITQVKYTYNGSFHGTYKGKILSADEVTTNENR